MISHIELLGRDAIKKARAIWLRRVVHDVKRTGVTTTPWQAFTPNDQYTGWINFFGSRQQVWTWIEQGRGEPGEYTTWTDDTG